MAIKFEIITLHNQNTTNVDEDNDIQDVLTAMANVHISDLTKVNPVETDTMGKLLFACNENKCDVILIIGNIESVRKRLVTEAIKNVNISKELSERVARSVLNIETRLNEIMPDKTVCGIRNQTLIIDLSGPHKNTKECFEAIADMILQTIHLIRTDKDQNVSLHDVASTSDDNFIKQIKSKIAVKRRKKSTSPSDLLSSNANPIKRHKESFPMISIIDAQLKIREIISKNINEMTFETVQLSDAYGRILCEIVESTCNLPPFKAASKHGYAVLATDGKSLRKVLNVENTFPPKPLEPGTCVWVNSRAPIPDGATAVVQVKDTKLVEKSESSDDTYIEIIVEPQNGENIKPVGYDLMKGKIVTTALTRIGPMELGLLAASGRKEVIVAKNISIGVLSIGNNLEEPGETLKPGFIYDVNRITLISLLKEKDFDPLDFGIVHNKVTPIQNRIGEALKKVDVLVTTGSTNDRDLMKTILEKFYKADIHFGNVNMKPGKSTIFATCKREIDDRKKYFLCLPGNPVSALIAAQLFLLPFVEEIRFNFHSDCTVIPARIENEYTLHTRSRVAWSILEWTEEEDCALAYSKGNAVSDKLISAAGANALLILPEKEPGKVLRDSFVNTLLVKFPKRYNNKNFYNLNKGTQKNPV